MQWPYSYDSCDVGTAPNQTINGLPVAATENGDPGNLGRLSYLPGQRLSRCTCTGESHPGPVHSDGTYVGRSAPEIDVFEAQVCFFHAAGCFVKHLTVTRYLPILLPSLSRLNGGYVGRFMI
jgi:hypothetical protein